jgi:hypothetical protein
VKRLHGVLCPFLLHCVKSAAPDEVEPRPSTSSQVRAAPPGARLEGEGRGQAAELQPLRSARSRHAPACAMRQPAMRQPAEWLPRAAPTAGCSGRSHPAKRAVAGLPAAAAPIWLGPLGHPPYTPPRSIPLDHPRPRPRPRPLPLASPQEATRSVQPPRPVRGPLHRELVGHGSQRCTKATSKVLQPGLEQMLLVAAAGGRGGVALLQVSTAAARILAALRWRWRRPLATTRGSPCAPRAPGSSLHCAPPALAGTRMCWCVARRPCARPRSRG